MSGKKPFRINLYEKYFQFFFIVSLALSTGSFAIAKYTDISDFTYIYITIPVCYVICLGISYALGRPLQKLSEKISSLNSRWRETKIVFIYSV